MDQWVDSGLRHAGPAYRAGMDQLAVRRMVYERLAADGEAPSRAEIIEAVGDVDRGDGMLTQLHDDHMIVLADGEILMALPFAARPTEHRVVAGDRSWWANCAWDALAVPVALGIDAAIEAEWLDTGEAVDVKVRDGGLSNLDGFVHFAIPARHWWDDIVET